MGKQLHLVTVLNFLLSQHSDTNGLLKERRKKKKKCNVFLFSGQSLTLCSVFRIIVLCFFFLSFQKNILFCFVNLKNGQKVFKKNNVNCFSFLGIFKNSSSAEANFKGEKLSTPTFRRKKKNPHTKSVEDLQLKKKVLKTDFLYLWQV